MIKTSIGGLFFFHGDYHSGDYDFSKLPKIREKVIIISFLICHSIKTKNYYKEVMSC